MLAMVPDTLHAVLMIVAGWIGLFAGLWLYTFFFSSGEDADGSFREAAEYPLGGYSWGYFKIMVWVGLALVIGVVAYHSLDALVDYFSTTW